MSLETLLSEALEQADVSLSEEAISDTTDGAVFLEPSDLDRHREWWTTPNRFASAMLATPAGQQIRAVYEAAVFLELNRAEDESALATAADEAGAYR